MMLSPSDTPWNIPALFMRRFVTHYLNFAPQSVAFLYSNCKTWLQTNFEGALFKSFFWQNQEGWREGAKWNGLSQAVIVAYNAQVCTQDMYIKQILFTQKLPRI